MDLNSISTNPQLFKESQAKRYTESHQKEEQHQNIDTILELYQLKIKLDFQDEMLRRLRNVITPRISAIKKAKKQNQNNETELQLTELDEAGLEQIFNLIQEKTTFDQVRPTIDTLSFDSCLKVNTMIKQFLNENKIKRTDSDELLKIL
jgi:seryl-tRNA synthetase